MVIRSCPPIKVGKEVEDRASRKAGGYIGEGTIGYAGPGAVNRGRLAADIVRERLKITGVDYKDIRFDFMGLNSLHREVSVEEGFEPYEVILRVAAKTETIQQAQKIGNEVETLYTNGPYGGGGATKSTREIVAVASTFVSREIVSSECLIREVKEILRIYP